jgi:hypothetical protein
LLVRRADLVEGVGAGLELAAAGWVHRRIVERLDRPVLTVRGWLRCWSGRAARVAGVFTSLLVDLADDPSAVLLAPAALVTPDAVSAVVGFALAAGIRFDIRPGPEPALAPGAGGGAGGPGAGSDHPRPRHRPMAERQRQTVVWNGLTDGQRERLTALGVQPQAAPITLEQPGPAKSAAGRSTAFTRGPAAVQGSDRLAGGPQGPREGGGGRDREAGHLVLQHQIQARQAHAEQLAAMAELGVQWRYSNTKKAAGTSSPSNNSQPSQNSDSTGSTSPERGRAAVSRGSPPASFAAGRSALQLLSEGDVDQGPSS